MIHSSRWIAIPALAVWLSLPALPATMLFTDSASFFAAVPTAVVENFEGVPSNTAIAENGQFGGIAYSSNTGAGFLILNQLTTTSPVNYLGSAARAQGEFHSGEELEFQFGTPVSAFGLYIVASPGDVLANDFQLVGGGASVFNAAMPQTVLAGGGDVFFLGILSSGAFQSARLNSFGDPDAPFFRFVIDDVSAAAVPEPATFALCGVALVAAAILRRRAE